MEDSASDDSKGRDGGARINANLEVIHRQLDLIINLLFDLIPDERLASPASLTDRAGRMKSLGLEISEISRIIGRPSNYASSRIREYESRPPRRKKKASKKTKGARATERARQRENSSEAGTRPEGDRNE